MFFGKLNYERNCVPVSAAEIFAETPWPREKEKRMTRPTTPTATASASDGGPEIDRSRSVGVEWRRDIRRDGD